MAKEKQKDIHAGLAVGQIRASRAYVKEVILENFMSHEYSRIPLKPGLNVILGPNGAGKSSILLGISVALGQTYTERAQKLSDLIRRGKDACRVTVVFNNEELNGKRPFKSIPTDTVSISRYLKRNGDYWHYVNNKFMTKAEVEHLLSQVGINPNNMLIIMHQNMIEQFASKSSTEKLKLVEDAVGASRLRERIIDAEAKLKELLLQEKDIKRTLEEARATVDYWREEYEKLIKLKGLMKHKHDLELELAWSYVLTTEYEMKRLEQKLSSLEMEIKDLESEVRMHSFEASRLREAIRLVVRRMKMRDVSNIDELDKLEEEIHKLVDELVEEKVDEGISSFKIKLIENEIKKIKSQMKELDLEYASRLSEAERKGPRIDTQRKPQEILDDLKALEIQIASLGSVTPDAEDMYMIADSKYREVESRAQQLAENIKRTSEEVEKRKEVWREFLRSLISEVEPVYCEILRYVDAEGRMVLRNLEDIENASIDLYVGFRGAEPTLLDSYTQSGGERIVATLAFLLALQKHVRSPFRAVDEFDVHLDPLNRERMIKMLTSTARSDPNVQYIIITPGYVDVEEDMNVILVQNTSGRSSVSIMEG